MIDKFKTGNPIWVYYNDIDSGANLTVPQLLRGFIGQEYQIEQKQFPNYRYVKTEGETKGTFDMRQRIVHLFYRKQNWGEDIRKEKSKLINNLTVIPLKNVQAKVDYLHNKSINVYDAPYGNKVAEIPNGETITLIGKLNDNDEITWYQVGRKKYITSNYIQIEYPEDDE